MTEESSLGAPWISAVLQCFSACTSLYHCNVLKELLVQLDLLRNCLGVCKVSSFSSPSLDSFPSYFDHKFPECFCRMLRCVIFDSKNHFVNFCLGITHVICAFCYSMFCGSCNSDVLWCSVVSCFLESNITYLCFLWGQVCFSVAYLSKGLF